MRMTQIRILIIALGIIMFAVSNPILLIPGLAITAILVEHQANLRKRYKARRRIRDNAAYVRRFK